MFVPLGHFLSFVLAILVHEAGHIAAMYLFGFKPKGIKIEISGFCIDYSGLGTENSDLYIALSGPLMGLIYCWAVKFSAVEILRISAQLSFLYSCVNMLPVKPLDGWRVFNGLFSIWFEKSRGDALIGKISIGLCCMLFLLGLVYAAKGEGSALLAFSFWLMLMQT